MKNLTKNSGIIAIGVIIMIGLILAGCATTVPTYAVRSPKIDTKDVQKLQIKDFENKSGVGGSDITQITRYVSEQAAGIVRGANFFTIVNDSNAEGIFTGEVRSFTSKDSQTQRELKDKDGNVTGIQTIYQRDVTLEFAYSVMNTRTNVEIGKIVKSGSRSSTSTAGAAQLTSAVDLAKRIVDDNLKDLKGDVVPTLVVASKAKLMKETSKDKSVKAAMKAAEDLVKNGKYDLAVTQYNEIADKYDSDAAKFNAKLLKDVIASNAAAQAQLAALYDDKDGVADKAVKKAVDAISAKLPAGSNIMIMKQSSTEPAMLDFVLDNMTKTVVQGGKITVIDRTNQAIIDAEQKFQLSGNVDDASAVSIGNQLGVRYAVLCWISGVSSERKLNIKVLDIQTSGIAVQDSFEI